MSRSRQDPTKADDLYDLSAKQRLAVEFVVAGNSDQKVAQEVGVTRQTVNVWRNRHPAFRVEVAARQEELLSSLRNLHLTARLKAFEVMLSAIEGGDLTAAMSVLRLPLFVPKESPESPHEVIREMVREHPDSDALERFEPSRAAIGRVEQEVRLALATAAGDPAGIE